ncbi:MAG: universal stress protein [Actinomycetota bacterium]|nr:universal stress protein [Actinomycetota bacterium]
MYKNIVTGTDGSETAGVAVKQAADLAKTFGAKLHLVSAYRPVAQVAISTGDTPVIMPEQIEELDKELSARVDGLLSRISDQLKEQGIEVEVHSVAGDASDALLDTAEYVGADLIVVGNRGMGGVKRFLLGSVPNNVSHHATCNVLIVHTVA